MHKLHHQTVERLLSYACQIFGFGDCFFQAEVVENTKQLTEGNSSHALTVKLRTLPAIFESKL